MTDRWKPQTEPPGRKRPNPPGNSDYVRPAGPEAQEDPPEDWDMTDEESDESFPASDPPANY